MNWRICKCLWLSRRLESVSGEKHGFSTLVLAIRLRWIIKYGRRNSFTHSPGHRANQPPKSMSHKRFVWTCNSFSRSLFWLQPAASSEQQAPAYEIKRKSSGGTHNTFMRTWVSNSWIGRLRRLRRRRRRRQDRFLVVHIAPVARRHTQSQPHQVTSSLIISHSQRKTFIDLASAQHITCCQWKATTWADSCAYKTHAQAECICVWCAMCCIHLPKSAEISNPLYTKSVDCVRAQSKIHGVVPNYIKTVLFSIGNRSRRQTW